ncbi:deoxyribodipyrimidine photo-lyase [Pseudomonas matsuisoli]|uniref:Deoxyribodipyrimidine photo-lyase n=1 Tax=Pseudomonas matsuisoli TaxID=1515666 RepID=A0A917Q2I6_9PSED|nr:deoxyribodipyrimidine photo-lyase [Pseudomonas matsuisoli]GGK07496.1 deoxyribodipyrimidine photo-lyase [Pseudomonas matsuisoli]
MHQLIWFRTDLRVHDNHALASAMAGGPTLALYVITPGQWHEHDDAACKVDFWLRNLAALRQSLEAMNVPLLIRHTDKWDAVPAELEKLCRQHAVGTLHFNDEYGVNESRRDDAVEQRLEKAGVNVRRHVDQLFFRPGTVLTQSGGYFKVFSQFRKVCHERLHTAMPTIVAKPRKQTPVDIRSDAIPKHIEGFDAPGKTIRDHWPAGEDAARKLLKTFVDEQMEDYEQGRDIPSRPGTSRMSAYLAAGVISPRQCLHAALGSNQGEFDSGQAGTTTWINELLWREFYKHILVGYPRVSMGRAFRPDTERLRWEHNPEHLAAWQKGRTGIPIIDAAMRQLKTLGWMHNRLRMLTAMFLSKNLLIDWREGERWFMQHLIDGDFSANNGGWQWSASTGTDSVPYFRIFNPVSQSQRFDPKGTFIREWVPELKDLDAKRIHDGLGQKDLFEAGDYPAPIVDLKETRQRALAAFRDL